MKKTICLWLGLVTSLATQLVIGGTLNLKLEPDRDYVLKGSRGEVVVKIDLGAAAARKHRERPALNIVAVLDRSGSMAGAKIEKARQAAMDLVDQLVPGDIFSLVTYSDHVEVLVPARSVDDKEELRSRISRIHASGSTALYAGVQAGAEQLKHHLSSKRINRIILLSDGLANVGPSSPRELRRLGQDLSEEGIAVTTIGLGDDYNEDLMAGLAEASDANYYYVKDTEKLPRIFAKELGELLSVAAREVRIQITCPDGVRPIGLIGRPEKFNGQSTVVQFSQFLPEQNRCLFLRCKTSDDRAALAMVKVNYTDELNGGTEEAISGEVRIRYTGDRELAEKSIRRTVVAEKELFASALAKDQAIADADSGKYQEASRKLSAQAAALDQQYDSAPAYLQQQIKSEAYNLRQQSEQLSRNQYSAGSRKSMQSESFNTRNSK
jgi:Ca-activated chloride channel family protein